MNRELHWELVDSIFKSAMGCRDCFVKGLADPAYLNLPQPRGIGREYFSSHPKVAMVLLNPGRGDNPEHRLTNDRHKAVLEDYMTSRMQFGEYLKFERSLMDDWGKPRGRFLKFIDFLGLSLDKIAVVNLAWCADSGNKSPTRMLSNCFDRHTSRLLEALAPQVAILSGAKTRRFGDRVRGILPDCEVQPTLHYAHRMGKEAENRLLKPLRDWLQSMM